MVPATVSSVITVSSGVVSVYVSVSAAAAVPGLASAAVIQSSPSVVFGSVAVVVAADDFSPTATYGGTAGRTSASISPCSSPSSRPLAASIEARAFSAVSAARPPTPAFVVGWLGLLQ